MSWALYSGGSKLLDINVRVSPLLQLRASTRVVANPHTGDPHAYGDAELNPAPVKLRLWLSGTAEEVLDALSALGQAAREADELRYIEGSDYAKRMGAASALYPVVTRLQVGYIEAELEWLPDEPYWRDSSGDKVELA